MARHSFTTGLTVAWLISLAVFNSTALAILVNVTIDDSHAEGPSLVQYSPSDYWKSGNCTNCAARPDVSLAYGGTWHDSSHVDSGGEDTVPTASLNFTGSAIYVYAIISHSITDTLDGNTDMTFLLNGEIVGQFRMEPTNQSTYSYSVLVYFNASIPYGDHVFELQNGRAGGPWSLALLDYIVYSTRANDGSDSPGQGTADHSANVQKRHVVVGASVACVVLLIVALTGAALRLRRRRLTQEQSLRLRISQFNPENVSTYVMATKETQYVSEAMTHGAPPPPVANVEVAMLGATLDNNTPSGGQIEQRGNLRMTGPHSSQIKSRSQGTGTVPAPPQMPPVSSSSTLSFTTSPIPPPLVRTEGVTGNPRGTEVDLPPPSYHDVFRYRSSE